MKIGKEKSLEYEQLNAIKKGDSGKTGVVEKGHWVL